MFLTYGPSGGLRTITSFFTDIEFEALPLFPSEDVSVVKMIGSVVARTQPEMMEAVASIGASKKAFDIAIVDASTVSRVVAGRELVRPHLPALPCGHSERDPQHGRRGRRALHEVPDARLQLPEPAAVGGAAHHARPRGDALRGPQGRVEEPDPGGECWRRGGELSHLLVGCRPRAGRACEGWCPCLRWPEHPYP